METNKEEKKRITLGILAHVDAGKTTLSEAMLYRGGCLKRLGRVDHQDAFLDTNVLERQRGITIFSKQAILSLPEAEITLLDTPGHADFSSEMERTLSVLDIGILVISGTDGIQGHTQTLWRLLRRYQVPVFLFINKMDLAGADRQALLAELRERLDEACEDFSEDADPDSLHENAATMDEEALNEYLEEGRVSEGLLASLIARRRLFPCYFGSALKLEGIDALLRGLVRYGPKPGYPEEFGARIYKIARDPQGNRLTMLKITGGSLRVKTPLTNRRADLPEEKVWEEKVNQIRIYSGEKFQVVEEAPAGTVCALTGLTRTRAGEGLGFESAQGPPVLEPVLTYRLELPEGREPYPVLQKLRQLEEEDPQLRILWNERLREIHFQLMGEVQLEILRELIRERFGILAEFGPGNIVYRETIAEPVEGVGHFEPLRHYAEVRLLLEPGERGSGLRFAASCGEEVLDRSWQRLVLTHLEEKEHLGVLTGSPITDMRITLIGGRGHIKHTEGGDFRQATYRAARQGLARAKSVLLEPWYEFRLELQPEALGRAMADFQRMSAKLEPPESCGQYAVLTGSCPASELGDYAREVQAYTRGQGRLFYAFKGYEPCHNQDEVVAAIGYEWEKDLENTADSVFCSHGAGFTVKWDQVERYAHTPSVLGSVRPPEAAEAAPYGGASSGGDFFERDKELRAIFEKTYGEIKRREFLPQEYAEKRERERAALAAKKSEGPAEDSVKEYLLVDGYNIIFAWDELKLLARQNLDAARRLLMDILSNYQGFRQCQVILVFDAYKVPHGTGEISRYEKIYVVYTREAETADAYIEKATYEISKKHRVRVATSDSAEQLIILGHGALRLSAREFQAEVERANGEIAAIVSRYNQREKNQALKLALEKRS